MHSSSPPSPINAAVSQRIALLRYGLIVGIVFLHIPPYVPMEALDGSLFGGFVAWIQHGLFRATVPVLTTLSAYLLFSTGLQRNIKRLLRKKTHTLLLPLVLFNLPVALAVAMLQARGAGGHGFSHQLYPPQLMAWLDALLGVWNTPANYALHFLRDLYVVSLLAPLLGTLARVCPRTGLLLLFAVVWWDLDGDLVLRDSMLINFYTGALAALYRWDLQAWDRYRWIALGGFLVLSLAALPLQSELLLWLRLLSPFLLWPASALLLQLPWQTTFLRCSQDSFFIYLCHAPALFAAWLVYRQTLTDTLPYWVFWWLSGLLSVVCLGLLHRVLRRFFSTPLGWLLGRR